MAWSLSEGQFDNKLEKKKKKRNKSISLSPDLIVAILVLSISLLPMCVLAAKHVKKQQNQNLRFGSNGEFKILQVADMHFADGKITPCLDMLPPQFHGCSDLNTSAFVLRMIQAEKPNLIVFTGILSFPCHF